MPLFVDVHPPPESPPAHIEVLLEACTQAAPEPCNERDPNATDDPDAIVQWRDGYNRVAVWVHTGERTLYRHLAFSEVDQERDRIMAAGLLLGSLVRESQEPAPQPATKEEPTPEEPVETQPVDPEPKKAPQSGFIQPSFGVGQGIAWKANGRLDAGVLFWQVFGVYGAVGVGVEPPKTEGVRLQSLQTAAGVYGQWLPSPALVDASVGFHFQQVSAQLTRDGRTESLSTGRPGAEFQLGIGALVSPHFSVGLRYRGIYFPDTPRLLIGSTEVTKMKPFENSGHLSFRLLF